ncbi:hypothetical protein C8Q74DRAFT_1310321 [Fomes fomentarius]|nr:hypothetical protein C8Q74DRAFT_1310321 [Fomes fomentarius]
MQLPPYTVSSSSWASERSCISDMSHPSPVLNHDVLRTVVGYVGTKTLLSLMLYCHAHYQVCVPVLLAKPAVCLDQAHWPVKKMRRVVWFFLQFMSADRRHWQSLRGLIFGSMLRPDEVELLAEGIKHAPNIAHLEFKLSDHLLSTYSDFHAARVSLKTSSISGSAGPQNTRACSSRACSGPSSLLNSTSVATQSRACIPPPYSGAHRTPSSD